MSWPIGYATPGVRYETSSDGVLSVNGAPVTGRAGWLELTLPEGHAARALWVQVRVSPDAHGAAYYYAGAVQLGSTLHASVHGLAMREGAGWIVFLARAIPREVQRRSSGPASLVRSGTMPIEHRAVAPLDDTATHAALGPDGRAKTG